MWVKNHAHQWITTCILWTWLILFSVVTPRTIVFITYPFSYEKFQVHTQRHQLIVGHRVTSVEYRTYMHAINAESRIYVHKNAESRIYSHATNAGSRTYLHATNAGSRTCLHATNAESRTCLHATNAESRTCLHATNGESWTCLHATNAESRTCFDATNSESRTYACYKCRI